MSIQIRFTYVPAGGNNPESVNIFPRPVDYSFQMNPDRQLRLVNLSAAQTLEIRFHPLLRLAFDPIAPAKILLYGQSANEVALTFRAELATFEESGGSLFEFDWAVHKPGVAAPLPKDQPGAGDVRGQR